MHNRKSGCNGSTKAVKAECPHCGNSGKKNWNIIQVTMALLGGGTGAYFVWECVKCGLRLLHTPFGF